MVWSAIARELARDGQYVDRDISDDAFFGAFTSLRCCIAVIITGQSISGGFIFWICVFSMLLTI